MRKSLNFYWKYLAGPEAKYNNEEEFHEYIHLDSLGPYRNFRAGLGILPIALGGIIRGCHGWTWPNIQITEELATLAF
jgi:hypothetical protein